MKKFLATLLCFIMLLSLFSCKETEDENDLLAPDQTDAEEFQETDNNDNNTTKLSEADKAIQMYEAVLKNEIKAYETDIEEYNYLKDCKTPYDRIPLSVCGEFRYVYTDLDNDGVNELVIACGDTLILRYYEGSVYIYPFTHRQLSHLYIDGSYAWSNTGENFEYGWNKIYFEGAELKIRELYRIVNDGEPNAEYYIEGKQVTREEFLNDINYGPELWLQFEPLEVSWRKKITSEEALQIASEYWETEDGSADYGAGSMWVCHIMLLDDRSSTDGYYHIGLQTDRYRRDGNDLRVLSESRMEHLFVHAITGECQDYVPVLGNGTPVYGKG